MHCSNHLLPDLSLNMLLQVCPFLVIRSCHLAIKSCHLKKESPSLSFWTWSRSSTKRLNVNAGVDVGVGVGVGLSSRNFWAVACRNFSAIPTLSDASKHKIWAKICSTYKNSSQKIWLPLPIEVIREWLSSLQTNIGCQKNASLLFYSLPNSLNWVYFKGWPAASSGVYFMRQSWAKNSTQLGRNFLPS